MAAALEGASERQHMVVAEDLNGHINPGDIIMIMSQRRTHGARGTPARVGPGESRWVLRLPVLCKPPAEIYRSPALVATARPPAGA
jgi:hypothetical protein